jgi:signal transduction histidine kinase
VLFAVERKGNQLHLAIDDNGRGFRFGGKYMLQELESLRLGPKSIKRRVRALGGDLTLESNPGQGSNLRVTVPLY